MAYSKGDEAFALELLEGLGPISNRPMFGCGALYSDGLLFGLIDDGVFYLRADDEIVQQFRAGGARQFTYPGKDGEVMSLGYWTVPDAVADDPEAVVELARLSIEAARRKAAKKKPKRART
jgi:DNA transformation protein